MKRRSHWWYVASIITFSWSRTYHTRQGGSQKKTSTKMKEVSAGGGGYNDLRWAVQERTCYRRFVAVNVNMSVLFPKRCKDGVAARVDRMCVGKFSWCRCFRILVIRGAWIHVEFRHKKDKTVFVLLNGFELNFIVPRRTWKTLRKTVKAGKFSSGKRRFLIFGLQMEKRVSFLLLYSGAVHNINLKYWYSYFSTGRVVSDFGHGKNRSDSFVAYLDGEAGFIQVGRKITTDYTTARHSSSVVTNIYSPSFNVQETLLTECSLPFFWL